jgi:Tfp pilus assembly protein PilF
MVILGMPNLQRIAMLQKFIEEEPQNPFNTYALAMEYYQEDPEKSLGILKALLQEAPDYLPSYYKAAHLYWDRGELELAASIFEKGKELAKKTEDQKALGELNAAFMNLQFEME